MPGGKLSQGRPLTQTVWFNAVWFQTTWFCAVLGRDALLPFTAGLILLHLYLVPNRLREFRQLGLVALAGILVDAALSALGLFNFANDALVPLWLCGLWLAFATTFNRSLAFLADRRWLAVLAGALVVPFNYGIGASVGAVEFGYSLPVSFTIMGVVWAILLPSLYLLVAHLDTCDGGRQS